MTCKEPKLLKIAYVLDKDHIMEQCISTNLETCYYVEGAILRELKPYLCYKTVFIGYESLRWRSNQTSVEQALIEGTADMYFASVPRTNYPKEKRLSWSYPVRNDLICAYTRKDDDLRLGSLLREEMFMWPTFIQPMLQDVVLPSLALYFLLFTISKIVDRLNLSSHLLDHFLDCIPSYGILIFTSCTITTAVATWLRNSSNGTGYSRLEEIASDVLAGKLVIVDSGIVYIIESLIDPIKHELFRRMLQEKPPIEMEKLHNCVLSRAALNIPNSLIFQYEQNFPLCGTTDCHFRKHQLNDLEVTPRALSFSKNSSFVQRFYDMTITGFYQRMVERIYGANTHAFCPDPPYYEIADSIITWSHCLWILAIGMTAAVVTLLIERIISGIRKSYCFN